MGPLAAALCKPIASITTFSRCCRTMSNAPRERGLAPGVELARLGLAEGLDRADPALISVTGEVGHDCQADRRHAPGPHRCRHRDEGRPLAHPAHAQNTPGMAVQVDRDRAGDRRLRRIELGGGSGGGAAGAQSDQRARRQQIAPADRGAFDLHKPGLAKLEHPPRQIAVRQPPPLPRQPQAPPAQSNRCGRIDFNAGEGIRRAAADAAGLIRYQKEVVMGLAGLTWQHPAGISTISPSRRSARPAARSGQATRL